MSQLSMKSINDSTSDRAILRLDGVGRTFVMGEVSVEVLKNILLEVRGGEFLSVVGPSGSGKTTILNILGGLDTPSVGTVWYKGRDITRAGRNELTRYRRRDIGFIFQFYNLVPNLTARENVMASTEIADDPLDVDDVLAMVGLTDRKDHFPAQLSGGEQQRVAIARAVAKNPELLLCDEPTGALDFESGTVVLRLLVDMNRSLKKTVVVITHNAALAQVGDRIVYLRSGQITETAVNATPRAAEEVVW